METQLTPDQTALIRDAVASGRLNRPEDALQEGLMLWEERERKRLEILGVIELSKDSLAKGEGRRVTSHEEAAELLSDIVKRGVQRLGNAGNK